ncbi:hypothetical protein THAOC_04928, partial [Thalassiosira oceanica]
MSVEGISQYDETALYYTTRHKAIHQRMPGSMALTFCGGELANELYIEPVELKFIVDALKFIDDAVRFITDEPSSGDLCASSLLFLSSTSASNCRASSFLKQPTYDDEQHRQENQYAQRLELVLHHHGEEAGRLARREAHPGRYEGHGGDAHNLNRVRHAKHPLVLGIGRHAPDVHGLDERNGEDDRREPATDEALGAARQGRRGREEADQNHPRAYPVEADGEIPRSETVYAEQIEPQVPIAVYQRKGFVYVMAAMTLLAIGVVTATQLSNNSDGSKPSAPPENRSSSPSPLAPTPNSPNTLVTTPNAASPSPPPTSNPTNICNVDAYCPASRDLCMTPKYITWTGISGDGNNGDELSTLKNLASFPDSPDTSTSMSGLLEVSSITKYFGSRIQAWITPEYTCDYIFYMSADDQGELNISRDTTPDNKETIATVPLFTQKYEWDKYEDQQTSEPRSLVAGEKYYLGTCKLKSSLISSYLTFLSLKYKEREGKAHAEIAWSCASQGMHGIEVIDISKMYVAAPVPGICWNEQQAGDMSKEATLR